MIFIDLARCFGWKAILKFEIANGKLMGICTSFSGEFLLHRGSFTPRYLTCKVLADGRPIL